jgi:ABC-type transport system involved in multi-copper enzyme maturation permease subunit
MFTNVLLFEIRYHLGSRLFLFGCIIFFLLAFLSVASPNVQFGALGGANYNSPFAILTTHVVMAMIGVLVAAAFLNNSALRDTDERMAEIIYSTRIGKLDYVLARFVGAFVAAYLVYLASTLGFAAATFMPWLDPDLIGPFMSWHYVYAAVLIGLPTLFANSAIVYAFAVLTRDQRISYAVIIGLLVAYQVAAGLLGEMDYRTAAALVDPTGIAAIGDVMQYWTVFERNTDVVPIEGTLLLNRLLWLAIGVALLSITLWRFRFVISRSRRRKKKIADSAAVAAKPEPVEFSTQHAEFTAATSWHQFLARTGLEVRTVMRSVFFWVLLALAAALSLGNFFGASQIFGTSVYPVTRTLIQVLSGSVTLSLMIIIVFYGADLIWRDRENRYQDILGASPAPNWTFVLAKMVAALMVVLIFLVETALVAVLFQLFNGYTNIEPGLYVVGYLYDYGVLFYLAIVLSLSLQILVPNKYVGMLLMVVYLIGLISLSNAGFEDPLYLYGATSSTPYSDMNGYDGLLGHASWYTLYWLCFATVLGVLSYAVWNRGPLESLRVRIRNIGTNLTRPAVTILAVAAAGFLSLLAWIYYNTHIVNPYLTSDDLRAFAADYEKKYIHLKGQPVPRFTDVEMEVDLYPESKAFLVRCEQVFENKTDAAIDGMPVGFGFQTRVDAIEIEGATLVESDDKFNVYQYRFDPPLLPGERRRMTFEASREPRGFKHGNVIPSLLGGGGVFGNGTFVNSQALAPYLGFNEGAILTDRNDRWREDLEPVRRAADLDDESQWGVGFRADSDWVSFKATVTTAADQVAIAPGYLVEETTDGDRRRFVYEMDAPMQNFFAVLSARYASQVEEHDGVQLAVFYHPAHEWNVERIIESLRDSISYFGETYSPYQYRQMRVLEFPAYSSFAQSFPNTVPWSESIGFIADVTDPEDIDYVYYVGAHEVAHQWWAHQVSAANVQGQTAIIETLAQYSALMLMEREYGPHIMRRFLKYELDNYLSSRGGEAIEELPLYRVEGQGYIHYRKGSIVMYALKDYMGQEAVDTALRNFVAECAYKTDPYPRSRDLIRHLRSQASNEEQQALITDLFERITLWDLKVEEATASERSDGRFDVTIKVSASKFEADGSGAQTEVPLDLPIDIGIFAENPDDVTEGDEHVLLFEKHRVQTGELIFELVVDEAPSHVGIDPYNKLIDRNSDDNLKAL